jgi:hypothetical protein
MDQRNNLEGYNHDDIYKKYSNERKSYNRKKKVIICVIVTNI